MDTDLITNVKKALLTKSEHPMFFALVTKGATDGKLIVSKFKIMPKLIDAVKKETGGSTVIKGVCFGEDGTLVFETSKPSETATPVTKRVLKEKAGLALKVEYRLGRDGESVPELGEPDLPLDDDGAALLTAQWKAQLAEWTSAIKAALSAKGPNAADIGKLLAQANSLSKPGGDMVQALAKLSECHALALQSASKPTPVSAMQRFNELKPAITAALSAGGPDRTRIQALFVAVAGLLKNDPAQADKVLDELEPLLTPTGGAGTADLADEFKQKLAEWTPAIKTAMAAMGPNARAIAKLLAQATALAKPDGDMVEALAKLNECSELATTDAAPDTTAVDGLKRRQHALEADYLRVMKLNPPERSRLSSLMAVSSESLEAGDLKKAASALDALDKLLQSDGGARQVIRTTTQQVADLVADPGQLVAYRKALLQWQDARKQARSQLAGLKAAIGAKSATLGSSAAVLERVMDRLDDKLSNAIDAAINASDNRAREDLHERAAALARSYLMTISFDPLFAKLDGNPISPLSLREVLGGALKQVVAALPA